MAKILYLDQNAWVALAQGSLYPANYPNYYNALELIVNALQANTLKVRLSFTNIFETAKINDNNRRKQLARVQATVSQGIVIRGRRRILEETILQHIAMKMALEVSALPKEWFLSNLWFESAADYTSERFGFEIPERFLNLIRSKPAFMLFDHLTEQDDKVRKEAVRKYSESSTQLIAKIEVRRKICEGDTFPLRLRAYSAALLFDELDVVFMTAKRLCLPWSSVTDIGSSLAKSLIADVPLLNVERELVVRLEDQNRTVNENDLRDIDSFATALPFADVFVGEKPFVNLARQSRLGKKYGTVLLTSVNELTSKLL